MRKKLSILSKSLFGIITSIVLFSSLFTSFSSFLKNNENINQNYSRTNNSLKSNTRAFNASYNLYTSDVIDSTQVVTSYSLG